MEKGMESNKIINYGMPRSGTTAVFNWMRYLLDPIEQGVQVSKTHDWKDHYKGFPVVIVFRNILDAAASQHRVALSERGEPNTKICDKSQIRALHNIYARQIANLQAFIKNCPFLIIRYENLLDSQLEELRKLDSFLKTNRSEEELKQCRDKYSAEQVRKFQANFKGFSEYDRKTHIHGDHVSESLGKAGYMNYIKPGLVAYYRQLLGPINEHALRIIDK